jgi:hypothetical protein
MGGERNMFNCKHKMGCLLTNSTYVSECDLKILFKRRREGVKKVAYIGDYKYEDLLETLPSFLHLFI